MKRAILLCISMCIFISGGFSQTIEKGKWGVFIFGLPSVFYDVNNDTAEFGVTYNLTDQIALKQGLNLVGIEQTTKEHKEDGTEKTLSEVNNGEPALEFETAVNYYFGSNNKVSIFAGPYLSYGFSLKKDSGDYEANNAEDATYNHTGVGGDLGVQYMFHEKIGFYAQTKLGFTYIWGKYKLINEETDTVTSEYNYTKFIFETINPALGLIAYF